jgi:two-component system cell cycle sensor histidine kinase/response regulator CckA
MPKILAIDDKQDNLITVTAVLKSLIPNCEVITAQSGPEGIKKAKAELPDTILLDIKMPHMDGYEVCEILKGHENTKNIPVIMLTAIKKESGDLVRGLESGADAYLAKPIDESVLIAQVKTALRVKDAEDQLRNQKDFLEQTVRERTADLANSNTQLKREIKERKQAEDVLQLERNNLRNIFESIEDGIYIVNQRYDIQYVNLVLEKDFGPYEGVKCYRYFHDLDEVCPWCKIQDVLAGKTVRWEWYSSKNERTYDLIDTPMKLSDGSIGKLEIFHDITERKKMEAQLQQAQKMESIGALAGGIAHDFNNILSAIIGFSELAIDEAPKETQLSDNIQQVLKAGDRARNLVQQILAFSRKSTQEEKPIDIIPIVKEVLELLQASLPANVEIRETCESDLGVIMADPTQIHQVLMNLCTNAAHAMRENGGVLDIKLARVEVDSGFATIHSAVKPGHHLKISISDTGHGMSPKILEKIFEPYFTTKQRGEGTGLGMAVVQGIVESHGGGIIAKSELGKGTVFDILIPILNTTIEEEFEESEPLPTGTEHILFVDDEQFLTEIAEQMLMRLGYTVTTRTSSVEALELFKSSPIRFDMVITDMDMPNMSGDSLAQTLIKIRPDIPIILCTGYSDRIDEKRAKELGIKAFAMKPFVMRDMAVLVRKVLDFLCKSDFQA